MPENNNVRHEQQWDYIRATGAIIEANREKAHWSNKNGIDDGIWHALYVEKSVLEDNSVAEQRVKVAAYHFNNWQIDENNDSFAGNNNNKLQLQIDESNKLFNNNNFCAKVHHPKAVNNIYVPNTKYPMAAKNVDPVIRMKNCDNVNDNTGYWEYSINDNQILYQADNQYCLYADNNSVIRVTKCSNAGVAAYHDRWNVNNFKFTLNNGKIVSQAFPAKCVTVEQRPGNYLLKLVNCQERIFAWGEA